LNGPRLEAAFVHPQGVAVDSAGVVYVADTGTAMVRKISANGAVTTLVDFGSGNYYQGPPTGVAVDGAGNVYEVDPDGDGFDGGNLRVITPAGVATWVAGFYDFAPCPASVAVDSARNLYLTDLCRGLVKLPATGGGVVMAKDVTNAWGVAVDRDGVVYVADTSRHRILRVTAAGSVTTLAGSGIRGSQDGPAEAASFDGPVGIAVDASGRVYVADTGNHVIRRFSADGFVITLAGSGRAGKADGTGRDASFSSPRGVALGPGGDLYVADTGNNLIRRIALPLVGCAAACTDWTVPSVARTAGPNGTFWTSDLTVHNRGAGSVPLTLKFLGHDVDGTEGPERTVTIGPYQTVTFADVLASVFGLAEDWGAVRVLTPSSRIAVRSRTSTLRAGGSIGDGVPGVRTDRFFTDETAPTPVLTGLGEDDRFRSNLVLVNGSAVPLEILVTAFDSSGTILGSRTYALRAFEATQDSRFLARVEFGGGAKTDVTVSVSTATPGGMFTAYAALIDNGSNAPTTVLPQ
jgi:sugar lactone lactonase YvrE